MNKKEVKAVVDRPKVKKKGLFARLSANLDELGKVSVKEYIFDDIIAPGIKNLISNTVSDIAGTMADTVSDVTDVAIWGEKRSKKTKKSSTSYSAYYKGESSKERKRERTTSNRYSLDYSDLVFETRGEAEDVLSSLKKLLDEYETVSVADFLALCDMDHDFVDQRYGWTDLTNAYTSRGRDGYVIKLPKAREID